MKTSVRAIASAFDIRHLGYCARCMQISFFAMLASWLLAMGAFFTNFHLGIAFSVPAVIISLLWLGHVISRATKTISAFRRYQDSKTNTSPSERREVLRAFGQAVLGATAVSIGWPLSATLARGQASQSEENADEKNLNVLDVLRSKGMEPILDTDGAVLMASCGNACKYDSQCSSGCICWPELGRCVKLGG